MILIIGIIMVLIGIFLTIRYDCEAYDIGVFLIVFGAIGIISHLLVTYQ